MDKDKTQFLLAFGAVAITLAGILPAIAFGQTSGSTIVITRTPFLTMADIPTSFAFNGGPETQESQEVIRSSSETQEAFSNANGALPAGTSTIAVRDTRNSGGFNLQVQATNFVSAQNPTDIIEASNLRAVITPVITPVPDATLIENVYYLTGYAGNPTDGVTQTVRAGIVAVGTNFSSLDTFDEVESRLYNRFNTPIEIFSACLSASQGRVGTMATGIAYALHIPPYTAPGNYYATITYTIMDDTQDSCP
jgi:hypothetical protein